MQAVNAVKKFVGLDPSDEDLKKWRTRKYRHYAIDDTDYAGDVTDASPSVGTKKKGLKESVLHMMGMKVEDKPRVERYEMEPTKPDEPIASESQPDRPGPIEKRRVPEFRSPRPASKTPKCCDNKCCRCFCFCGTRDIYGEDDSPSQIPFFTFYITFVQTLILICTLSLYGVANFGFAEVKKEDVVLKPNLAMENDQHSEFGNIWLGPDQQSLIHLGAKYSPCMRKDPNIASLLELDRAEERSTGCCVRDDGSGCVQTVPEKCSALLSTFVRWENKSNIHGGYKSGAVCGTDPRYCKKPASTAPFQWDKTDFTKWPICEDTNKPGHLFSNCAQNNSDCHMNCDLLGRPCCHGIQGECMITTREHCEFRQGYFHEDKFLCSQVNCMEQICGMIPFVYEDRPDQYSRVLSANLLHAGIFQFLITLIFQLIFMRAAEAEIGWIRMLFVYLGSGIMGTLASAVLVPYQVSVGPSAAQWGVIGNIYIDIIDMLVGPTLKNDTLKRAFGITTVLIVAMFILGLFLPYIDNIANFFGLISGVLISGIIMKDIDFVSDMEKSRCSRIIVISVSVVILLLMFVLLMIFFYATPLSDASWIKYLNCAIDQPDNFCKNMDVVPYNRGATYSRYV